MSFIIRVINVAVGVSFSQAVPATVDGMLGGFGQLSSTDAASSRRFIQPFMKVSPQVAYIIFTSTLITF